MARADEVVAVGVHEFPNEVLVEVTRRNEEGFLVVESFPFEEGEYGLEPTMTVPEEVEETVSSALIEDGYALSTA